MGRRTPETLADYAVVAIAPLLIMLLVGSLILFLTTVFYHGDYPTRLAWVLCLFVMATVCVTRISMEEGASYAALFGLPLGIVVAIAMMQFVRIEGPLAAASPAINLGLMALIWWSADRLTWDCTLIDDAQDTTNEGLLQSMGWDEPAESGGDGAAPQRPWWQRWFGHDKRPAAHGKWVVYFSVAALPLFGLGQWFIPASDTASRRFAFLMLVMYVASGLGLLLTTSFLGLRRYIGQRRLEMPMEMATAWLGTGVAMILALLFVAAILPRPSAEFSLAPNIFRLVSPERIASRWGVGPEGAQQRTDGSAPTTDSGKGQLEGQKSGEPSKTAGERGKPSPEQGEGDSQQRSQQQSKDGGERSEDGGEGKQDKPSGSEGGDQANQGQAAQGRQGNEGKGKSEGNEAKQSKAAGDQQEEQRSSASPKSPERKSSSNGQTSTDQKSSAQPAKDQRAAEQAAPKSHPRPFSPARVLLGIANLVRWAFYGVVALAVAWIAWKYRRELLAAWRQLLKELRELWERWFGRAVAEETAEATAPTSPRARSFRDFADPFLTGQAARMSAAQLVNYSFGALEAWARDGGAARSAGDTPLEFADQLAADHPTLATPARQLAEIYSRMAYAGAAPPAQTEAILRNLWRAMAAGVQPSAVIGGIVDKPAGIA